MLVMGAIRTYQYILSPDHGIISILFPRGFCKFRPTCSMYMYHAVDEFGIILGLGKGLWRICRCNPWSIGGDDPIKK